MTEQQQNLYDLPDNTPILEFVMLGRPATKKTSQRIVKRGRFIKLLPSLRYEEYEKLCKETFENVWKNKGNEPISVGVGVKLTITLNSWVVGDETGYQQAMGDLLEKYEIISNDQLIHWLDLNSHMITQPDKLNPQAKIQIFRYRHPLETRENFLDKFENEPELEIDLPKRKRRPKKTAKKQTKVNKPKTKRKQE
jgi:hypothetical protein